MDAKNGVSVIIPCYNSGKHLKATIESVLKQTYPNFEIIIVDDGSTDKATLKFLSTLPAARIIVYHKGHEGVSAARNYGIQYSTGDFILPLDADDLIAEDYLELAAGILQDDSAVKLVTCNAQSFGYRKRDIRTEEFTLEKLLAKNLFVVSSMFRRADYDKTSGFNPNMKEGFEDWDFWLSLLADGGKVHNIGKTCFYYRMQRDSRNNGLDEKLFRKLRHQIYENHAALYRQYRFDPTECFEYELIKHSMEYKLGRMILKPFRFLQKKRVL
ncbi:MAG: glycosyltransferase family A protein [Bacteroidota bacterium]|nr:glycosyltransferase family A protein [Bacteroidota bacterium]